MRRVHPGLLVGVALFISSCGSGDGGDAAGPVVAAAPGSDTTTPGVSTSEAPAGGPNRGTSSIPPVTEPPVTEPVPTDAPPRIEAALPDVSVYDVVTGDELVLASLLPAPRPILLWMWAPH